MGFRLLREGSHEYDTHMVLMKEKQLRIETDRWRNLTRQDPRTACEFLTRFYEALQRSTYRTDKSQTIVDLSQEIKRGKPSLASVQGNLEVARLSALL